MDADFMKFGDSRNSLEKTQNGCSVREDGNHFSSKKGEGKRLWKKMRYQLVEYHSLPSYLRDNEYIIGHYRSEWPLKQILLSIFTIHNETLNVWTHLIGFFLFLALTIYTAMQVPKVVDLHSLQHLPDVLKRADLHRMQELMACLPSMPNMSDLQRLRDELKDILPSLSGWRVPELLRNCLPERFSYANHTDTCVLAMPLLVPSSFALDLGSSPSMVYALHSLKILLNQQRVVQEDVANMIAPLLLRPITRWPFFAFLGGVMFCLLASSTCHLLSCHSERLSYIMLRLDYAGIAALISTSFYPPVYYSFMCNPFFCNLYLGFITILGIATVLFSLLPVFQNPEYRTVRACLFFGMGLSGVLPILHKLKLFWDQPEALHTTGYELLMGAFYGLGALVYATRIPERWMPGKFDIAGHSHQLFHVLVVAGAYTHYHAGLVYLKWRDLEGC
ncbi:Heptahelical transmembrane protein 4 [Asimina triloba]